MAFGSMYVGATGITAHSTRMQQISSNIANINTLAYKSGYAFFENTMSRNLPGTASGFSNGGDQNSLAQVGTGVRVANTRTDFAEGSFEPSSESTDLAIGGKGFFGVRNAENDDIMYTRAGHFLFDKDGVLTDSHGYALQGYTIDENGVVSNTREDIALPIKEELDANGNTVQVIKSDPKATTEASILTNLDSDDVDLISDSTDPFFSLMKSWNGNSQPPLNSENYSYDSSIKVWDKNGNTHDLVVYFDKVTPPASDNSDHIYWEFVVGTDPSSDARGATAGTSSAGLLMTGTITFAGDGSLQNLSAYTLSSNAGGDPKDLSSWGLADFSEDGTPMLSAVFADPDGGEPSEQDISLNMGIKAANNEWNVSGTTAADVGSNASNLVKMNDGEIQGISTTGYWGASTTINQSQNGFGEGYLQNVTVDKDGVLSGLFSNGLSVDYYKINLYNFTNEYGLRREGSNYFSETTNSGGAIEGVPETEGMGSTVSNSLETSNVDLASEFAQMILTQRGFQANSKVITTSDSIINNLLGVKK